ncbi:2-isopropylmalate synthase [Natronobacterium gregoryi]|uniref:(R)-citramalate synthase n=2 Tax=Natronobacterium gregoryi TaxID=44930 RepID=L0ADV6_NATGS|nr:2-isopropylmalate synthase [Natronobacterium gregoryi]AFZ71594.1 isopropylmalate/homocitrate/citramalate synthase [Natronobacterium gregoryi SP2]ELY66649.1 (R)-citramalate synthase [Natronobacterium gregoryi SP2]PLK21361.1 2-isopropylmalate synthase [Natronobacterium gregoryi SP2]SFI80934.1 D-citramalate synthase [Natronobacterium gregoryi]
MIPSDRTVRILDTTLRDGEQAPGVSLSPDEKVEIARALERAGVSTIEAGSACTGTGERRAISRVTDLDLEARVTSFCRGLTGDVDLALECDVDGVHIVVPSSDRHVEGKVGTSLGDNLVTTAELVEYATDHDLWVEVIGEDGSRADLDYLAELAETALDAGADRFCFADTVGHTGPEHTAKAVSRLAELGPVSAHTHDDLGLGVANALAAVAAGADLIHCTVDGLGERAGNVALEEVAIALSHVYDIDTVDLEELYDLAQTVSRATGVQLPPNKAVVGENAFTHESGIHTDGTLKDDKMYEPYAPETVGRERRLALGKHTGRAGVEATLAEHGVEATDDAVAEIAARVTELGDRGRRVTDADLLAIAEDVTGDDRERMVDLLDVQATSGGAVPTASVRLEVDGEQRVASGTGSGPVDAAVSAIREAIGSRADAELESYHVDAVTGGTDAVVTVEVTMGRDDRSVTVARSEADITRASVDAMVDALDRLLATEEKPFAPADD